MLRKSIAAMLALCLLAWAEMALLPLFALHAWHEQSMLPPSVYVTAHHHHGDGGSASCCPGVRKSITVIAFSPASVPCTDEHRCCFGRAPLNVPSPASAGKKPAEDLLVARTPEVEPGLAKSTAASTIRSDDPIPPPFNSGMVLRV